VLALLRNSGISQEANSLKPLQPRNGYQYFSITSKSFRALRPARIKPVFFPAEGRLIAAYYVEITGRRTKQEAMEGWGSIVSAQDGRVLRHDSLIHEVAHSYRVYTDASGVPRVDAYGDTFPHPTARPDGWLPTSPAAMQRITLDHAGLTTADPWLPAGATHTIGNNVDAFFNGLIADGGLWTFAGEGPSVIPAEGDFRAPLSAAGVFDYGYDVTVAPGDYFQRYGQPATPVPAGSAQLNAKIVQAFYVSNWLHDLFYDLGFDEASGNPQHDNYGRGGLAGDRLVVNAAFPATFVYTPADGESPQMHLGLNGSSGTRRDASAFDFPVIAHEWTHILFRRLAIAGFGGQQGALNEGTADFVGLLLSVRESHRDAAPASSVLSGAYGLGAYFNRDYDYPADSLPAAGSPGVPDNTYYHGIRRFPYSADLSLNPLSLRHIGYDADLPVGSAPFDWKFRSVVNAEVHSAGEVWASALWQCARNILADETRFVFEERKRRVLAYLVAGLKLFPADADFIEARNAILFAMRAADDVDYELCRQGFATRGFGSGALAPARFATGNKGVRENFSSSNTGLSFVAWRLEETAGGDGDGVLDVGENGRLTVTLKNSGLTPLEQVRIFVPPLSWAYAFPSGSTSGGIVLQPNEEHTTSFDVQISTTLGAQMLLFNLSANDEVRSDVHAQHDALFIVNYDLRRDNSSDWQVSQQGFEADWTTGFESDHGCAMECFGDLTNWERVSHLGDFAYRIESEHVSLDAHLTTAPFTLHSGAPFRIVLTHDYDLVRTGVYGGSATGDIEISVAGGAWEPLAPHLVSGSSHYFGASGGWRTDTVDLGTAFGGRTVRLRWRITAGASFTSQPVHWALSRISIQGASTPMFSSMYVDVH
ncbi:MAG: M36 family metallopeptidase, partial [Steroidobacter sp.]